MYEYRKMTPAERAEILKARKDRGFPLHEPPHLFLDNATYLFTAACFEHKQIIDSSERISWFSDMLLELIRQSNIKVFGWVVLPNHYHLLVQGDLPELKRQLGRMHNRTATRWNREDSLPGRRVWYKSSDRIIRSERHFYASLNYIHYNPVKHGYTERALEWPWSSLSSYTESVGNSQLIQWWSKYPIDKYGEGWDDW